MNINKECDWESAAKNIPDALSAKCVTLLNEASTQVSHVNMYNVYGDCVSDMCAASESTNDLKQVYRSKIPIKKEYIVKDMNHNGISRKLGRITPHGPDACIDSGSASAYLNREEVMEAIHVRDPGNCWSVCSQARGWSYQSTRPNLPRDTYPLLVNNIHVLIYNGDWDACVPYTDNEAWTENMGFPVRSPWHSWTFVSSDGNENQVGGYAVEYDVSNGNDDDKVKGSFEFITVRGGRHEVPESAPAQALEMLNRLINNKRF